MKDKMKRYQQWLITGAVCGLLMGCSRRPELILEGVQTETEAFLETETHILPETELTSIQVFVCGAVSVPGVYCLDEDARVYEAIEAAGGFAEDADQDWLNQASVLQDGMKLYVYTKDEILQMQTAAEDVSGINDGLTEERFQNESSDKVNLNTATKEELMSLPGIGESKAEAVIAYREDQGAFHVIEDIMNISGIKEAVFLKIKDKIVV